MSSTLEHDPRVIKDKVGVTGLVEDFRRRFRQGDIGQLPVILGLVVIWTVFQIVSDGLFLTSFNVVNLTYQMASTGTIAVGLVLVLLLGEIDLSAGVVSGVSAALLAVLSVNMGISAPMALVLALAGGIAIGALQGFWITYFGVPSFIVTLSGLISWQGLMLLVLGKTGTVNLKDPFTVGLAITFFKGFWAWFFTAAFLFYVAVLPLLEQRKRQVLGLATQPLTFALVRSIILTLVVGATVWILTTDRGINSGLVFLVAVVVVMDIVLRRTRFGRMIYAIGGNAEAARRAGIPVQRVRVAVFALAALLAAWGGVLSAARGWSVNQSTGGGPVLLNAIAAVVIGGTSLFGGRGTVWSALLGIIVIQSISNGMDLLSLQSPIKFMITGMVLLISATIDSVLRRGQPQTKR
jgi:D-xylose transport system permease protein